MSDIKKIMVALSLAGRSKEKLDFAADIASNFDAELVAVNIINSRDVDAIRKVSAMGYDVDGEQYVRDVSRKRENELKQIVQASPFPSEKVRVVIKIGNPIDELLKIIIEESLDMVVMGTKGRTGLEHVLVGSVAEKLFRKSPVTVVSFRDTKETERMRRRIHLK